ncbi:hypothetical protein K1719_041324 [Acacia pycnantha]|nr:hypothetical protein K1719_041324 [Acacia pycnantha]
MIEDDEQTPPSFNGDEFVISGHDLKCFHYEGEFQFEFNILSSQLLEECLLVIPEVATQVPMFNGVRHLELDYETSNLSNKGLLMGLTFEYIIENGIKMSSDPIEDNILDPLPPCFIYRLHFINVYIKKGDEKDLMGVKVLLENAMALVEMAIEFSTFVNKDGRNNFCVELLKLPRGSRYCGIYISG